MADKIKFSVKNVHYAVKQTAENGTVSYAKPVKIPGAVSLAMNPNGEVTQFYADGILYFNAESNNGYTGDLVVAYFPESFLVDVLGYTKDSSGVLVENANAIPKEFALLCEEQGDASGTKFRFFNVATTRPKRELKTKEKNINPQTQSVSITMSPLEDGKVLAMTGTETTDEAKNSWYTSVHMPVAAS